MGPTGLKYFRGGTSGYNENGYLIALFIRSSYVLLH